MMLHCIAEARQRGDTELLLEVIESNAAARRLYESVGMTSLRRLVGFECVEPIAATSAAVLTEMELVDFAALARTQYEPRMPWQIRPETLANLTSPFRAFSLENRAFVLIGDPTAVRVSIRGLFVRQPDRRRRFGSDLLRALVAKFPGKTWAVAPIVPEGLADGFFLANGFAPAALSQHEMALTLPVAT
jgi:ribosomal protein S18 acetylase RimI-like enzyme